MASAQVWAVTPQRVPRKPEMREPVNSKDPEEDRVMGMQMRDFKYGPGELEVPRPLLGGYKPSPSSDRPTQTLAPVPVDPVSVNMPHSCCSGTFSSRSLGGCLRSSGSSWGSSYPSNLVLSPNPGSPRPCRRGSSPHRRRDTCWEAPRCQTSCCGPRTPRLCGPCWTPPGALGCGPSSSCSLGCGSRGSRPLGDGVCGLPSQSCGSRYWCPTYLTSRITQSSCYRPHCGFNCY